ncbi:hypothetical protein LT493_33980 [Streptomyces tricolor]|nr:hypothetical protein [Streptomyces tricolor]
MTIDLPRILAEAQQRMLRAPQTLHGPDIEVDAAGVARLPEVAEATSDAPLEGPLRDYACARGGSCSAGSLCRVPRTARQDVLVVEGMDPRAVRQTVEDYGEAYLSAVTACLRALDRPHLSDAEGIGPLCTACCAPTPLPYASTPSTAAGVR